MNFFNKTNENDVGKQRRIRKVSSLQKNFKAGIHGSTGDNVAPKQLTRAATGDSKVPQVHYTLEQAFESFLQRVDEIYINLRKKDPTHAEPLVNIKAYQDICLHIRMEILIALDKLELLCLPNIEELQGKSEFFSKMGDLKTQLSQLRWLYHKAIKDLDPKIA